MKSVFDVLVQFVIPLLTSVGALGIFWVYGKQNVDRRKNTANTLLAEITLAQERATDLKNDLIEKGDEAWTLAPPDRPLLPKGSWDEFKHVLIRLLSYEEWRAVNEFYTQCALYDEAMRWNLEVYRLNTSSAITSLHDVMLKQASTYASEDVLLPEKEEELVKRFEEWKAKFVAPIEASTSGSPQFNFHYTYNPRRSVVEMRKHLYLLPSNSAMISAETKLRKLSKHFALLG
jgi:hypothetical protein